MDFLKFVKDYQEWNTEAFGPGERTKGHIDHITKELVEIEKDPHDTVEWVDIIFLAISGALRHGANPEDIIASMEAKLEKNKNREWPDWRTASHDQAINHIKGTHD